MTAMQAHLKMMTTSERKEFKRQITPNATQMLMKALKNQKAPTDPLSRETSPHANQTCTGMPPSRETGPHPTKSMKKLAQALKKRTKHEAEQRTRAPRPDCSLETLAQALKNTVKAPCPDRSMKTLADTLKRHTGSGGERPTRTYAEQIRELVRPPEQCEKCSGEHSTRFCMKQFEKLQRPETTSSIDDDSINDDTLCDSEESENDETESITDLAKSMTRLSLQLTKSVTFDLSESEPNTPSYDVDDSASDQSDKTRSPTSQNDEADEQLVHAAWLRKTSENVYMSNRKSMTLQAYVHAAHRRTEAPALLDSGATKNFMSLTYAKWLKLPFKRLPHKQPLFNIDGTTNKTGSLKYYVDLQVQTGTKCTDMHFFLTDLGDHKIILGYPWFAANQPKIDWV